MATHASLYCGSCGGTVEQSGETDYPGGGCYRQFRCVVCGETGWEALYFDGTTELGGCLAHPHTDRR